MIALDTNVVVRLLVEDDARQTADAAALVRRAHEQGATLFVSDVVVCEAVWVLLARYGFTRTEIAGALDEMTATVQARFESPDRISFALAAFRAGRGDVSDYLIREHGTAAGCSAVATFDGDLLAESGFVHPDPGRWRDGVSLHELAPAYGRPPRRRRSPARASS